MNTAWHKINVEICKYNQCDYSLENSWHFDIFSYQQKVLFLINLKKFNAIDYKILTLI